MSVSSRIVLESSNLRSIRYDKTDNCLEIEFQNGRIYQYFDIPKNVYKELLSAESHGRYFNHEIRDCYAYCRIK